MRERKEGDSARKIKQKEAEERICRQVILMRGECNGISMDRCIECPLLCMCQGLVQISPRVLFAKAWLYDNGKGKEKMA